MSYKCILFDWETLGIRPNSVVLDLAAVVFNIEEKDTFEKLVNDKERTFRVKFEVASQISQWKRKTDSSTLDWWLKQGEDAQKVLKPSSEDVALGEAMLLFRKFVEHHNIWPNKSSLAYVRGQSFDFPLMVNILDQLAWEDFHIDSFPVKFWNQRDVRTAIAHDVCTPNQTKCPLPKGIFDNFIAHNSVHDCVRDVISIQHAWGYKTGTIEVPEEFDLY